MVNRIWRRVALLLGFLVVVLALAIAIVLWRPQWLRVIGLGQSMNPTAMDMPMDGATATSPTGQAELAARWAALMARWQELYAQVQNGQSPASQLSQIHALVEQMQSTLKQMPMNNMGMSNGSINRAGMRNAIPMNARGMNMMEMMMGMMGMGKMSGSMNAAGAMDDSMDNGAANMSTDPSMTMPTDSLATRRMIEMLDQMMQTMNAMQRMVNTSPSLSVSAASANNLAQTSQIGAITVTVTPFSLKNILTDTVDFYVTLEAPARDTALDLAKVATLLVNDQEIPARSWTVLTGNTRPITGKLRFPIIDAAGKSLLTGATQLSLRFRNLDGDDQHTFMWDVPKTE